MNRNLVKQYAAKLSAERGVKVSAADAETEIVRTIQKVARDIAPFYKFGYLSAEDLEQEGVYEALIAIEKGDYDATRPLENFMHVHIHNRLYNYRRKHYQRLEPPCKCCDAFNPPAYPCQKWLDWSARNSVKQNLMRPLDMSNVADESENNMREESEVVDDTIASELHTLLDRELPVELRRDYLQMLDGKMIPKSRRQRVRDAVIEITREKGYLDEYQEEVAAC